MYSIKELKNEIDEKLRIGLKTGDVDPEWLAAAVMADHPAPDVEDADFWVLCADKTVRDEVRRIVARFDLKPTVHADRQIVLPGFERLQQVYIVSRDNRQIIAPIENCTKADLMEKAGELHAMGAGCFQHEDEIMRYVAMREQGETLPQ